MKYVCTVCGYVYEGESLPADYVCPVCKAPADKFLAQGDDKVWAAEHVVGVAKGVSEDIIEDLRANFNGECSEVGMYLAMARVAHREGYPEVGLYYEKAAWEEAEHAAKFAELLGEVVTDSTKKNLEMRVEAENGLSQKKGAMILNWVVCWTNWPGSLWQSITVGWMMLELWLHYWRCTDVMHSWEVNMR